MQRPILHIVGAGLAGLSAAVALGRDPFDIIVHEAARHAGGRCRSFFDETLNMTIDASTSPPFSDSDTASRVSMPSSSL